MMSEETLEKVREAFDNVRREHGSGGWGLDDALVSPFPQESNSDRLTVSLVRGGAERAGISLDLRSLLTQEGAITVMGLEEEIEMAMHEKGLSF